VIADRPQTIVWAFTLSSRTSIWRFMAIWPSVESLFSITPLPGRPWAAGADVPTFIMTDRQRIVQVHIESSLIEYKYII